MDTLIAAALVAASAVAMEFVAAWTHEHVMHGWGWRWHRSHHEAHDGALEANDLYALVFAALSAGLFWAGAALWAPLWWVAVGVSLYGAVYFVVHDGLVHRRWPFRVTPRRGWLRRIYQAHRLHHAVEGRDGCVSFGFVLVDRPERLKALLAARRAGGAGRASPCEDGAPPTPP